MFPQRVLRVANGVFVSFFGDRQVGDIPTFPVV